jgi:formylglycine-generating enzyme required for sulfatase activity
MALSLRTTEKTVALIVSHPQLLDLARRPVMMEFVLEALPDIEAGKPVDLARVYLYAIGAKLGRDIKSERTFTSMADKLYFMCELSWEMLTQDRMSLNYRMFPDRLRDLFGDAVAEQKDLDHWHYDMMNNSLVVRNGDGDYAPAHRSLLEFFVAYRIAAHLGVLPADFADLARQQSNTDEALGAKTYTWRSYFSRRPDGQGRLPTMPPLESFRADGDVHGQLAALGRMGDNVYRFLHEMTDVAEVREQFHGLLGQALESFTTGRCDAGEEQSALVCVLKARCLSQVWEEESSRGHAIRDFWRRQHAREWQMARGALTTVQALASPKGDEAITISMVEVPAGGFPMGGVEGSAEEPIHLVRFVRPFLVGRTPVTNREYMRFAQEADAHWPEWCEPGSSYNVDTGNQEHYRRLGDSLRKADCPVVGVSWEDAVAFANWMSDRAGLRRCYAIEGDEVLLDQAAQGYRLLTEAEWEYACRAGCSSRFCNGDPDTCLEDVGWFAGNSQGRTHPVGGKSPNAWGLLDMHGNVWEWCEDDWHENYKGAPTDGSAWVGEKRGSFRVIRGGCWFYSALSCRSASRYDDPPGIRYDALGFRLSRSVS